ncbi:peptidoglycan-binding protein [Phormidesmis sp. 146-12]
MNQQQWLFEVPFNLESASHYNGLNENLNENFEQLTEWEALPVGLRSPRFRNNARLQAAANNKPPMRPGERGQAVQILQQALIDLKFPMPISTRRRGTPDGIYGAETTATVRKFQQRYGLKPDGIVGKNTLSRLDRLFTTRTTEPRCGVPSAALEMPAYEAELFESTSKKATPKASLCLYQQGNKSSGFFSNQAGRWAKRISAIANPTATNACGTIGATPYRTGEDIIRAINETFRCLNQRLKEVHIFSHSYPEGIIGDGDCVGLYRDSARSTCATIQSGGRSVSQIPTAVLAQDVVFVLHGCNTAVNCGQDSVNFARDLFNHLAAQLDNPRVFGHPVSVCAGQQCRWCEYSNKHPKGRRLATIPSIYSGNGFCGKIC